MVVTICLKDDEWVEVNKIPGWLNRQEADLLYELCESPWCEIGCFHGKSLNVLAKKGHGWAIDPLKDPELGSFEPEFFHHTKDLDFTFVHKDFRDAVDDVGEIRFLHLDADHSYEATKEAFDLYAPKLSPGRFLVMHDAWPENPWLGHFWPGVYRLTAELMADEGWICVGGAGRSAAFRKL